MLEVRLTFGRMHVLLLSNHTAHMQYGIMGKAVCFIVIRSDVYNLLEVTSHLILKLDRV